MGKCEESAGEVWQSPVTGDMVCFNGKEWVVARRKDIYYQVDPIPEISPWHEPENNAEATGGLSKFLRNGYTGTGPKW